MRRFSMVNSRSENRWRGGQNGVNGVCAEVIRISTIKPTEWTPKMAVHGSKVNANGNLEPKIKIKYNTKPSHWRHYIITMRYVSIWWWVSWAVEIQGLNVELPLTFIFLLFRLWKISMIYFNIGQEIAFAYAIVGHRSSRVVGTQPSGIPQSISNATLPYKTLTGQQRNPSLY